MCAGLVWEGFQTCVGPVWKGYQSPSHISMGGLQNMSSGPVTLSYQRFQTLYQPLNYARLSLHNQKVVCVWGGIQCKGLAFIAFYGQKIPEPWYMFKSKVKPKSSLWVAIRRVSIYQMHLTYAMKGHFITIKLKWSNQIQPTTESATPR